MVAERLTVTGEIAGRDRWLSSYDDSFECPDLEKYFPRDLMNDATVVDDRFSEATVGMLIVCDLFGVEDEAEAILCELSISVKYLDLDVDSSGDGSSEYLSVNTICRV